MRGSRSNLGGHYAGTGMNHWEESEENYKNHKVHVRLENDYESMKSEEFDKLCEELSGEVKTYKKGEVNKVGQAFTD